MRAPSMGLPCDALGGVAWVFETVRFGWCTSRRFHNEVLDCHVCRARGEDRQEHYVVCGALSRWADDRLVMTSICQSVLSATTTS